MTEHPILFNTEMVRAILDGRKTSTRRPMKEQPLMVKGSNTAIWEGDPSVLLELLRQDRKQPIIVGDHLWVRETWAAIHVSIDPETGYGDGIDVPEFIPEEEPDGYWTTIYRADETFEETSEDRGFNWRPSIHMPRWASRLTLCVSSVRVQRLQDITEEEAQREGVEPVICLPGDNLSYVAAFGQLWDRIYHDTKNAWDKNPWVWGIEFEVEKP